MLRPYIERKNKLRTKTTKPTKTDQSQAKDTDLNVIVQKFLKGQLPNGAVQDPLYADFTRYPQDLRGFIETSRSLNAHRSQLPDSLKGMSVEQLMALTPEQLHAILAPPAPPPANPETPRP